MQLAGLAACRTERPAAQVLMTQLAAKEQGYNDVVYLDAKTDTFLEEVSSCNIFTVSGRTIRTPPLSARSQYNLLLPTAFLPTAPRSRDGRV